MERCELPLGHGGNHSAADGITRGARVEWNYDSTDGTDPEKNAMFMEWKTRDRKAKRNGA